MLKKKRMTVEQIGNKFHVPLGTVRAWLKRLHG